MSTSSPPPPPLLRLLPVCLFGVAFTEVVGTLPMYTPVEADVGRRLLVRYGNVKCDIRKLSERRRT